MELRIAGIVMFLRAALVEQQRQQLKSSEYRGSHVMASRSEYSSRWGLFECVSNICISLVTMGVELYLAVKDRFCV
jgi:hypothetical protein